MKTFLLLLLCSLLSCSSETQVPDPRIRSYLEGRGIDYEIDEEGDFVFTEVLENGRHQKVWIRSTLNQLGNVSIREVLSPVVNYHEYLPQTIANNLLQDNYRNRLLGSWSLAHPSGSDDFLVVFAVKIPADGGNQLLEAAIVEAAVVADEMQEFLTSEDVF